MIIDVFFVTIKVYEYSKLFAFITGILLGCISFLYFYNGLNNFFNEVKNKELQNWKNIYLQQLADSEPEYFM